MINFIKDKDEFSSAKKMHDFFIVLFYTNSSQKSLEALDELKKLSDKNPDIHVYAVNASNVSDIHRELGINAVPTVVTFKNGEAHQFIYGLQTEEYYKRLLNDAPIRTSTEKGMISHRVTVYSSPSCPWCSATKAYLRQHNIRFRDVDVTKDQNAAAELVRRSGQRGVPQTDIDGTIVVGFDKPKLNRLLGIAEE
ncbi:glutaredoxin domain-containing protein [Thermoanaerobacterium sp. RBIITD]|uniref:glutaredoxin domain-containing protein n=1 Tax=Thermoanaerobacterium sp. RBIITD TaxID=1550240 RepID=UPI000BB6B6C5|nr:glutaredoxin domain-containing protein [Thermoanaerobacterium sp. RBIITD]SNX53641.1 Glutaredoxin-like protein, YruB-family [Thermoanaerobacterium sp. RBIITD]